MLLATRKSLLEDLVNDPAGVYDSVMQKAKAAKADEQEAWLAQQEKEPTEFLELIPDDVDLEDLADADFELFLPWYQLNHIEHQLILLKPVVQKWAKLHAGLLAELLYDDLVSLFKQFKSAEKNWEATNVELREKVAQGAGLDLLELQGYLENPGVLGMLEGPNTEKSKKQGPAAAAEVVLGLLFGLPSGSVEGLRKRAVKMFPFFEVDRSDDAN